MDKRELRMMAAGDFLIHTEIVKAAKRADGYDFSMLFAHMQSTFQNADLLVGNMETILTDRIPPRGFPRFATPTAVGDAIEAAGFHLVTLASNHTLDLGAKGMADAVDYWGQKRTKAIGIRDIRKPAKPVVLEKNGIRIAMLNYTVPTNYHFQPLTGAYRTALLRPWLRSKIRQEITDARALADFVAVFPHWGTEYLFEAGQSQKTWAQFLADCGADILIGTHPHVVQNVEILSASDGRTVPCIYSIGNFISCQKRPSTMLGAIADVTFTLDNTGEKQTSGIAASLIPIVSHTNEDFSYFTTYPLAAYSDSLAKQSQVLKIVEADYGIHTDTAALHALYDAICKGEAQKSNPFQNARQVFLYNIWRILKLILTGGKSAGRK